MSSRADNALALSRSVAVGDDAAEDPPGARPLERISAMPLASPFFPEPTPRARIERLIALGDSGIIALDDKNFRR